MAELLGVDLLFYDSRDALLPNSRFWYRYSCALDQAVSGSSEAIHLVRAENHADLVLAVQPTLR